MFSDRDRGIHYDHWSQYANPFDGFIYFSRVSGRGKVILDGDFLRLNTFANDDECKSVVSINVIAGGPVTVADRYQTAGIRIKFYQNRELMSLVDDGFIALGDTACLTKPTCGEGCTSSLYQAEIAVEVISKLLKEDKPLTKENMWSINKRYFKVQGKDFDALRPLLIGIISFGYDEAEYLFKNDVLFSQKILGGMGQELDLGPKDIAKIVSGILAGVTTGKLKMSNVKKVINGLMQNIEVAKLYDEYPDSPAGYFAWKEKADVLWDKIGKAADTCDPEILRKLGIK